jgi:hypothetical protein
MSEHAEPNDLVERLRSGEDGLEYAAADELEALRTENARLREALAFYVRIRAQPVELVKDFGNTAEAALEWKP